MATYKNTVSGRVVDRPDSPPDIASYQGKVREARQKKWDQTTAKMEASNRWTRETTRRKQQDSKES